MNNFVLQDLRVANRHVFQYFERKQVRQLHWRKDRMAATNRELLIGSQELQHVPAHGTTRLWHQNDGIVQILQCPFNW